MGNALKKIGFFLVTIMITAAIFWLVFIDKESQQDVLDYSLGLLGEKLLAMVPEGEEKGPVKKLYQDFMQKAKQQQVAPEQMEGMAATILNLSNMDTVVTAGEAEAILKLSLAEPVRIERVTVEKPVSGEASGDTELVAIAHPKTPQQRSPRDWVLAAERIKSAYRFNLEYQRAMREAYKKMHKQRQHLKFHVDDGLKITIDANLKPAFDQGEFKKLRENIRKMELQHRIIWRQNFREEMLRQRKQLERELQSLRKLKELKRIESLEELEALKSLESLKCLEALQHIPIVNADSIRMLVEKHLEQAGQKK